MTNLATFSFEHSEVRTVNIDGQVAFCLSDVLKAIGSNTIITYAENSILKCQKRTPVKFHNKKSPQKLTGDEF